MTRQRMVELLEIEMECVRRNGCGECNRACHICDLLQDDTELHEMYEEVIALMKAQELVEANCEHRCNKCKFYEGVHNVMGHAPCSLWKISGVMWNDYCSRFNLWKDGEV